jgi:hypothetical protein
VRSRLRWNGVGVEEEIEDDGTSPNWAGVSRMTSSVAVASLLVIATLKLGQLGLKVPPSLGVCLGVSLGVTAKPSLANNNPSG